MRSFFFLTLVSVVSSLKYHYAIDLYNYGSSNDYSVMKNGGYETVFVSGYVPTLGGTLDPEMCQNLRDAGFANMPTHIYMNPSPTSTVKNASQQAQELMNGLNFPRCTYQISSVWIQVVQPSNWPKNTATNLQFINDLIATFKKNGVVGNIFTSKSDWQSIVGTGTLTPIPQLWYYNVNGAGITGETAPNFNDFVPFNGWTTPTIKQFAQTEQLQYVDVKPLNRNVYVRSNGQQEMQLFSDDRRIIVGGTF